VCDDRWQGFHVTLAVLAVADQKWVDLVGVLVLGVPGAFFLWAGIGVMATGKTADSGLRLTPNRVVYQAGGNQLAISWNDIARIHLYTITYGYRRLNPWPNFLGVEVHDPSAV
jgi:hypothetical protein